MKSIKIIFGIALFSFIAFSDTALANTYVSDYISEDETWTIDESPYIVNDVTIPSGITLTINPGVVVKVADKAIAFDVEGTLNVGGNNGERVYITSIKDNIGGITGNGSPQPEDWKDIYINQGGTVNLTNTTVRYGGAAAPYSKILIYNNGNLNLDNTSLSNSRSVLIFQEGISAKTDIKNSILTTIPGEYANELINVGGDSKIFGTTFNTSGNALNVYPGTLELGGNVFNLEHDYDWAVYNTRKLTNHGNNSGNGVFGIWSDGSKSDTILPKDGIPYYLTNINIPFGASLTIEAGAKVRIPYSRLDVYGNLTLGTPGSSDPVILTSQYDDASIGRVSYFGQRQAPVSGDWMGIKVWNGGALTINKANLLYGGQAKPSYITSEFCAPREDPWMGPIPAPVECTPGYCYESTILNEGGVVNVNDLFVSDSQAHGIRTDSGISTISNSTFSDSPIGISIYGGKVVSSGNSFSNVNTEYIKGGGEFVDNNLSTKDFYAEIQNSTGSANIRVNANTQSEIIKTLPTDWSLYVTDTHNDEISADNYIWWEVRDETDGTVGWIAAKRIDTGEEYLKFEAIRQEELRDKATKIYSTDGERVSLFQKAVDDYYSDDGSHSGLYSAKYGDNNLSYLKNNGMSADVVKAIGMHESGGLTNMHDNLMVVGDYGHGIMQVTTYTELGKGSGVHIPKCETSYDAHVACYTGSVNNRRQYKVGTPHYYGNTKQAIYANVKDGMAVLVSKMYYARRAEGGTLDDGTIISNDEIRAFGATLRYNQGSPWKVQAVYLAGILKESGNEIRSELISHKAPESYVNTRFTDEWVMKVQEKCPGTIQFTKCLDHTNNEAWAYPEEDPNGRITISANYLKKVSSELEKINYPLAEKMSKVANSNAIQWVRSPVELRIADMHGNISGLVDGEVVEGVVNTIVDEDTGMITTLLPPTEIKYILSGVASGTFGAVISNEDRGETVQVINAPTLNGSLNSLSINWLSLTQGGNNSITLKLDENGDGFADKEIVTSGTITPAIIEKAIPIVSAISSVNCDYRSDGWCRDQAQVVFFASSTDGLISEVLTQVDGGSWKPVSSTLVIDNIGTHTIKYFAKDNSGQMSKISEIIVKIGKTITVIPEDKTMIINGQLPTFTTKMIGHISDVNTSETKIEGLASCSVGIMDRTISGSHTIECSIGSLSSIAYDFSFATGTLQVNYIFSGLLEPMSLDKPVLKQGRTIPLKFNLRDASDIKVQALVLPGLSSVQQLGTLTDEPNVTVQDITPSDGQYFRYDAIDKQYVYNWNTNNLAAGYWYKVNILLDDGTLKSVVVGLK